MANQWVQSLVMAGIFSLFGVPAVLAEVRIGDRQAQAEPLLVEGIPRKIPVEATTRILELQDFEQPATTVDEWMAQIVQAQVRVTAVKVMASESGLEITLVASEPLGNPNTSVEGNILIAEITNAVLELPEGDEFQQANPAAGIALVRVTNLPGNRVRVAITGADAPPTAALRTANQGLVWSVKTATETTAPETGAINLVVTGQREPGYGVENTSTATGTDTPIRDIPFSIQVVPQEVIQDRNVTELGDALETVGGVVSSGGRGTSVFGPGFLIRGFEVNDGVFRDGIPFFSLAPVSTNDIERIEVLKGPASVLFGQGEPGGIINLISKKPLPEPLYSGFFTAGNFDTFRGGIDFSGPLNDAKTVKYRVNLSYENFGSFRDFVDGERFLASSSLTWEIDSKTSINFYGQYISDRETIDEGIPVIRNQILDVPRNQFFGEEFAEFEQEQFNLGYTFNHRVSDKLAVRHALQYNQYEPTRFAPLFDSFDEATGNLNRIAFFTGGTYQRFFTNAELVGKFNTGSVQHKILFGVEYLRIVEDPFFQFSNPFAPINVFNPVFTNVPFAIEPEFFRDDRVNSVGVYLQDQIDILSNLKILAGVRFELVDQFRTEQFLGEPRQEFEQADTAFLPRFGIIYQPAKFISLYGSYTTSFNPPFGTNQNPDGSSFEPETGRQFEVGVKADVSDRLSLTFAAFDIRRQNVTTPDPDNPFFSIQTGEVASRGIELTVNGRILPGWNITASYTYLDAFVSQDNTDIVGNQLTNVPDNQFGLFTTYEIQNGTLNGLGFGLGLFFLDNRPGNLENTFDLPSFFRTDMAVFYKRRNWRAQLNIENLFDIEFFTSSDGFLGVNPGAPFTVLGTLAVEF